MPPQELKVPGLSTLRPFRSFLFLKLRGSAEDCVSAVRNAISDLAPALSGAESLQRGPRSRKGELHTALGVYRRRRRAAWTTDSAYTDVEHHLIAVSAYKTWCAVFMSDAGLREAVRLELHEGTKPFDQCELVNPNKLNAVFVNGRARTLWLNNVQRRSALKADHKVLSGTILQDALDPLGDQAYAFSAARLQNDLAGRRTTYGVAPRKSRWWFKRSKNWDEYTKTVLLLLCALDEATTEVEDPLPVLSVPIDGPIDLALLGDAYEISLVPPELTDPADEEEADIRETDLVPDFDFDVTAGDVPHLHARVRAGGGAALGEFALTFDVTTDAHVSWAIMGTQSSDAETLAALRKYSNRLNVSFSGGFAISDGVIHRVRYRDVPFTFEWASFRGVNITKEKPAPLATHTIGTQNSLFCWVRREWMAGTLPWMPAGGWLASNDGALEVADFVHLSTGARPTLTLVHVKGAASATTTRGIAVAPYEVVVSQAVKNLRHVDPQIASTEFTARLGRHIQDAVWRDGTAAPRAQMLAALQRHGTNLDRRVVIVQPHTRRQAHEAAQRAREGSRERHLVRQLNGLLLTAQQNSSGLGAHFIVVGHEA